MTNTEIRAYVIENFGASKCRIQKNGEVHGLGRMPNSIEHGWYFVGFRDELVRMWQA